MRINEAVDNLYKVIEKEMSKRRKLVQAESTMNIGVNFIEMYQSMLDAIEEAGGAKDSFKIDRLVDMSTMLLFDSLATNKIRFYCTNTHRLESITAEPQDQYIDDMVNRE